MAHAAVYLLNRLLTSSNPDFETPYGSINSAILHEFIQSSVAHLVAFDDEAICQIPDDVRGKGDKYGPAAEVEYMVGYTESSPIYLV